MNRIEKKLQTLQEKNEKAFITYITAGLPDMEHCAKLIRAQEEAGLDILELGIPFSDPAARIRLCGHRLPVQNTCAGWFLLK